MARRIRKRGEVERGCQRDRAVCEGWDAGAVLCSGVTVVVVGRHGWGSSQQPVRQRPDRGRDARAPAAATCFSAASSSVAMRRTATRMRPPPREAEGAGAGRGSAWEAYATAAAEACPRPSTGVGQAGKSHSGRKRTHGRMSSEHRCPFLPRTSFPCPRLPCSG